MRWFLKFTIYLLAVSLVLNNSFISHGEASYGVSFNVFYDLISNSGIMELKLEVYDAHTPTLLEIPLYFIGEEARFNIINLSYSPMNGYVVYEYDETSRILSIMVANVTSISIWVLVENVIEEYAPGVYGCLLDLERFANAVSISMGMYFYGNYDVIVDNLSGGTYRGNVYFSSPFTLLQIVKPGIYFVVLSAKVEEKTVTTPATQVDGFSPFLLITAVLLIGGSASGILFVWWRRRAIKLETISTRDILSDEVVRDIILALGRAGEKGLQQSELVNITGRPKSSISRRIKRLEDEGLVDVVRSGKYNYLKLTDKGFEAYRRLGSKDERNG